MFLPALPQLRAPLLVSLGPGYFLQSPCPPKWVCLFTAKFTFLGSDNL